MENGMQPEAPRNPGAPAARDASSPPSPARRTFLGGVGAAAAAAAGGAIGLVPRSGSEGSALEASELAPHAVVSSGARRAAEAFQVRVAAARQQRSWTVHHDNGDEDRFASRIGSFSKGLPHDGRGEVDRAAYRSLLVALTTGEDDDFERIVLGVGANKLTNPKAGLAFAMEGPDAQALTQPPAPSFSSAEEAGEIVENYWMALTRDVPFSDYDTHPLGEAAARDLSRLSDFRGPRAGGLVTPRTLFRGVTPGDLRGPYLSQFMWLDTPFGAELIERRMRTPVPGDDHMTAYSEWLAIQNGALPAGPNTFDPVRRYVRNGRDLSEWVHIDVLFQAYFNALLILFSLGAPFDPNNPYNGSRTQIGFGTFGPPYMASVLAAVAREALKEVWFQKWFVHRRLRPEAFAGRVHNHITGAASYPIHGDVLNSAAVDEVVARRGTYLLPMAFPEGCPTHPAYGAGHATVAGACVTILKALFDESFEIPDPVEASPDGTSLVPFDGPPLTVGGELNKLASNVAIGRNIAGVHWRSDAAESLKLGEEIAIRFLRDERMCFSEGFRGFSLRKFDGTPIVV
jgi:hypothetical protein